MIGSRSLQRRLYSYQGRPLVSVNILPSLCFAPSLKLVLVIVGKCPSSTLRLADEVLNLSVNVKVSSLIYRASISTFVGSVNSCLLIPKVGLRATIYLSVPNGTESLTSLPSQGLYRHLKQPYEGRFLHLLTRPSSDLNRLNLILRICCFILPLEFIQFDQPVFIL